MTGIEILTAEITKRGVPKEIGARGWISDGRTFEYRGRSVATINESLKGWLQIDHDWNDSTESTSYNDVDTVERIIRAMVADQTSDTSLYFDTEDGSTVYLSIVNHDGYGNGLDIDYRIPEEELHELMREVMGEDFDEEDPNVYDFLIENATETDNELSYSYSYGVAHLEFYDYTRLSFSVKDGELVIIDQT